MADVQTTQNLTAENKTFYDKVLLKRLTPELVYMKHGQKKPIQRREGKTINFRRFNSLPPATTPLTEGVTPTGSALDVTAITATVSQYGDYVTVSDVLDLVGIDPVLTETAKVLGEQAGLTLDTIARDSIIIGTNVHYAGGKTSTATITANDKLTANEVQKVVRTLRKANAKPTDGKYFIGIISPEQAFDLMQDPLWQDISKYSGGVKIMEGEVGKLGGTRFVETSNIKVKDGASNLPIHCALIIGKDAYGVVDVDGKIAPEIIIHAAGSAGSADALNQRSTVGWKALGTVKIINELAMVRLETTVTQ